MAQAVFNHYSVSHPRNHLESLVDQRELEKAYNQNRLRALRFLTSALKSHHGSALATSIAFMNSDISRATSAEFGSPFPKRG
jgi:hypothetical protein